MIEIHLNGEDYELQGQTLADLVEQLRLSGSRYAIEVNREIIPRGLHAEHRLSRGDRVEVIHAVGGG